MDGWKRADLHLHTCFSGWRRLRGIRARDCYMRPAEAFAAARRRGMDFVCFTDHDTIDGALDFLSRHPEEAPRVIVGEEVETRLPGTARWLHLGVYGVDEAVHADLRRLKDDAPALLDYLNARRLPFALNHPFQSFRSIRAARRHLAEVLPRVPAVETLNSTSPRSHRRVVEALLARGSARAVGLVGGSDAHTVRRVAAAYTLAPGATREEFLENVRRGACRPGGEATGLPALVADVYRIVGTYYARLYGRRRGGDAGGEGSLPGSIVLLPAVLLGLPAALTALHALRQEWIARAGGWAAEGRARAIAGAEARPAGSAVGALTPES